MGPAPMIKMVEMSVRLGIKSHGMELGTKKGRAGRASPCHSVRETLARGWSLDQFPHPRNPQKRAINGEFQGNQRYLPRPGFALRAPATGPSSLSLHSSFARHALPRRSGVAAPRVARQGEAWRPGLDLNQDKERCTAPASTLFRHRAGSKI